MTLEKAQKNLKVMNSLNTVLIKLGSEKARKVLHLLINVYTDSNGKKEEMLALNTCVRKLDELEREEAEAAIKYLIDLHMRTEFEPQVEKEIEACENETCSEELPM